MIGVAGYGMVRRMNTNTSLENKRMRRFRMVLLAVAVILTFWWPLSHWLYSNWYHQLLGFAAGSYPDAMVKIIGACGITPVLLLLVAWKNPTRNIWSIRVMAITSAVLGFTFLYLSTTGAVPKRELINSATALVLSVYLFANWRLDRSAASP